MKDTITPKWIFIPSNDTEHSDHLLDATRYSIVIIKQTREIDKIFKEGVWIFKYLPMWLQKKIFSIENTQNAEDFGYTLRLKRFWKTIKTVVISAATLNKSSL